MGPSIEVIGASIEVVKTFMGSTETSSFLYSLSLTCINFRLLPPSLHMLASATMRFGPYHRGGGRAVNSLVQVMMEMLIL